MKRTIGSNSFRQRTSYAADQAKKAGFHAFLGQPELLYLGDRFGSQTIAKIQPEYAAVPFGIVRRTRRQVTIYIADQGVMVDVVKTLCRHQRIQRFEWMLFFTEVIDGQICRDSSYIRKLRGLIEREYAANIPIIILA
jgi:hypothetical protein